MTASLFKIESQVSATNVSLTKTVNEDTQVNFMGLNRTSAEAIGIEMSIKLGTKTFKMIDLSSSTAKDVVITDHIILPSGSVINIITTGVTTGDVNAVIIFDKELN